MDKYVVSGLSADDERLQTVICPFSRIVLEEYKQDNFTKTIEPFEGRTFLTLGRER